MWRMQEGTRPNGHQRGRQRLRYRDAKRRALLRARALLEGTHAQAAARPFCSGTVPPPAELLQQVEFRRLRLQRSWVQQPKWVDVWMSLR